MSIDDRIAITDNIYAYAYRWDAQDIDSFVNVFTEDAVWEFIPAGTDEPEVRLVGHAEIHKWGGERLGRRKGKFVSRHFESNIVFDHLDADTARTRTMVLVTHQGMTEPAPTLILTGVYHDEHRRTPEGWKLQRRSTRLDTPAKHVSTT